MKGKRNALFTNDDRQKVFQKIQQSESKKVRPKRFIPAVIIMFMLTISAVLLSDFLNSQNVATEADPILANNIAEPKTVLVSIKDSTDRVPINIVFTINEQQKVMNITSIPRDTYVQVGENQQGEAIIDKLTFAYKMGGGHVESVSNAVSNLLKISIDEAMIINLNEYVKNVGVVEYELKEDLTVRAIEKAKFDLKEGRQLLDGEQVASLFILATTNYFDVVEQENITKLFVQQLFKTIPNNELLTATQQQYSVNYISMMEGM